MLSEACPNLLLKMRAISDHSASVSLRHDLRPGDVGYITYLHGIHCAQDQGWDYTFVAKGRTSTRSAFSAMGFDRVKKITFREGYVFLSNRPNIIC